MSVMTPAQMRSGGSGVDMRGRPMAPLIAQAQAQAPPPAMQRDAVMDQLGTGAPPPPGAGPADPSRFARGGSVKQLPGAGTAGKVADLGIGTGAQVAGSMLAKKGGEAIAGRAASLGAGATGLATGAGISLGTDYLAKKLRTNEEMPEFGGEFGEYTDNAGRRFQGTGGGVASNAVKYAGYGANPGLIAATGGLSVAAGALGGAIKGAITKHAPSAYSDFKVEDAVNAIKAQYQKELGRPASDDEVEAQLVGQGWDPKGGDRWVGEKGLIGKGGVMDQIRASPEAAAFTRTGVPGGVRDAVVDQLGGPTASADLAGRAGQGAAPGAEPAGGGAPPDASGWDTDGYAAPAYVPASFGAAPPGFDQAKWNDPNHQTPKYAVTRILNQYGGTPEGVAQAMPDLEKAYPGATFNGKDKITIPGLGTIDVVRAAGKGGEGLQWIPEDGGTGEAPGGPAGGAPSAAASGAPGGSGDVMAELQAAIERIQNGTPDRRALMDQMGAANG